jgi:tRNA threonylcarbamoyladenosine biosynthesis protein TsaB
MKILSCNTSLGFCSIAIFSDGKIISHKFNDNQEKQAELLFELIAQSFDEAALSYDKLTHLACSIGPGSFTGLRIGLSAFRALAFTTGLPLIGVNNFAATAFKIAQTSKKEKIAVIFDARRGEAYVALFSYSNGILKLEKDGEMVELSQIESFTKNYYKVGDLDGFVDEKTSPTAEDISNYANYLIENNIVDLNNAEPLYIRKPDAKVQKL